MSDDLAPLFDPRPDQPSQDVRFRQGVIVTFDQNTLENTVLVGGATLVNLPLLGVGEVTSLVSGSVVGLLAVGGPAKTVFITGRIVKPNTDDATDAISLLSSLIATDSVSSLPSGETITGTSYADLPTIGPRVDVNISPTGRILIIATAQFQWAAGPAASPAGDARFDVAFSGANTRTPSETVDQLVGVASHFQTVSAGTITDASIYSITTQAEFTGLNPGLTTITMKYGKSPGATVNPQVFRRGLTVFRL
jgi:hypothetical protein